MGRLRALPVLIIVLAALICSSTATAAPICPAAVKDVDMHALADKKVFSKTPDVCCAICVNNSLCVAYSWKEFSNKENGNCYLTLPPSTPRRVPSKVGEFPVFGADLCPLKCGDRKSATGLRVRHAAQ